MRKKTQPKEFRSKRLVLCTDLSPLAGQALPLARAVLGRGGKLLLLHVVQPVLVPTYAGPDAVVPIYDREATRHLLRHSEAKLKALIVRVGIKGAKVKVVEADQPAKAIAAESKRFKADLVCLCTHGRSAIQRMLFGSVALKLLALYKGRVLLLRPDHAG